MSSLRLLENYSGPFEAGTTIADFSRRALARLGREWLLIGHLQDRVGMPLVLSKHTATEMTQVAIEEWMGASPIYSARTQRSLNFEGSDIPTLFKCIKLDIGAPHHFLDFQFAIADSNHGEFWLDHCGALMDAEPMGEDYVRRMCHDIEDPTFDATAAAISPFAKIRPLHRPPRVLARRSPHCHWTATIDEESGEYLQHPNLQLVGGSVLASVPIDVPLEDREPGGWPDLSGDIDPNFHLEDLSHSALVIALQEIGVQIHLVSRAFLTCVAQRWGEAEAAEFAPQIFAGVAGIGAERLRDELQLGTDDASAIAKVLQMHPVFFPHSYVATKVVLIDDSQLRFSLLEGPCFDEADAHSWLATFDTCDDSHPALDAIAFAINPHARSRRVTAKEGERHSFKIVIDAQAEPQRQSGYVSLAKISTGANVTFIPRTEVRR